MSYLQVVAVSTTTPFKEDKLWCDALRLKNSVSFADWGTIRTIGMNARGNHWEGLTSEQWQNYNVVGWRASLYPKSSIVLSHFFIHTNSSTAGDPGVSCTYVCVAAGVAWPHSPHTSGLQLSWNAVGGRPSAKWLSGQLWLACGQPLSTHMESSNHTHDWTRVVAKAPWLASKLQDGIKHACWETVDIK